MSIKGEKVAEITLYEDDISFEDESNANSDLVVESSKDYLAARKAIRSAASQQTENPIKVHVRSQRCWNWFRDLRDIGSPSIVSDRDGLRHRLEEKWERPIPSDLTPQEIHRLDLLDISGPLSHQATREYILERKLDEAWLQDPSVGHIAELASNIISSSSAFSNYNPKSSSSINEDTWIGRQAKRIIHKWQREAGSRIHVFYELFASHPQGACEMVAASLFALHLNRGDNRQVENRHGSRVWKDFAEGASSGQHDPNEWLEIARLLFEAENLQVRRTLKEQGRGVLHDHLLAYWNTHLRSLDSNTGKEITVGHLLDELPGKSLAELEALSRYVDESSEVFALSDTLREKLEKKFAAIEGGAEQVRSFAEQSLIPPPPPDPNEEWMQATSLAPWKDWLKQHYFPYKQAVDRNREAISENATKDLERQAVMFSDWVTDKYKSISHKGESVTSEILGAVLKRLKSVDKLVWIIWDNLPIKDLSKIEKSARSEGFYKSEEEKWIISVLPSITEFAMPATLSGKLDNNISEKRSVKREEIINDSIPDSIEISYSKSIKDIEENIQKEKDLHVFHYQEYDRILHKRKHELEDRREKELGRNRRRVFERLSDFMSEISAEAGVSLVVSSDHGSTLLPQHSEQIPLPKEVQGDHCVANRAIEMPETEFEVDALFDSAVSTVLDPDDFALDRPYVIARGFRSFKRIRSDDGYIHGGALPEEVLTPLVVFEAEPSEYMSLEVREMDSNLRRGEIQNVQLKITNRNDASLSPVFVRLEKAGEIVENKKIDEISGNTSEMIDTRVRIKKNDNIKDGHIEMEVKLSAHYLGRVENQRVPVSVSASERAVDSRSGQGLDDFFD